MGAPPDIIDIFKEIDTQYHPHNETHLNTTDENSIFLKIGDHISLFDNEHQGYFYSEGYTEANCKLFLHNKNTLEIPKNFSDCVFKVVPKFKYDAQQRLLEVLENFEKGEQKRVTDKSYLKTFYQAEAAEHLENNQEYIRMCGKPVTYGQIVQLVHVKSGKTVTITEKEIAEIEKHCLKVRVEDRGNDGSAFFISPRYSLRNEGDRVRLGDHILFMSKNYNMYLHSSTDTYSDTPTMKEINATSIKWFWQINAFNAYSSDQDEYLKAGDIVTFRHKETNSLLTYNTSYPDSNALFLLPSSRENSQHNLNSNSFWMVEYKNISIGNTCLNGQPYRLKHLATGQYLASFFDFKLPGDTHSHSDITLKAIFEGKLTHEMGNAKVITIHNHTTPSALFSFHLLNREDIRRNANKIEISNYVNIYHRTSRSWLGTQAQSFLSNDPTPQGIRFSLTSSRLDFDVFEFTRVPQENIDKLHIVVGQIEFLNKYLQQPVNPFRKQSKDLVKMIDILTELICSLTFSKDDNPLTREGLSDTIQQSLLREQHSIEVVINILKHTFHPHNPAGIQYADILKSECHQTYYAIVNLCFKFLKQIMKEHSENRAYLSRHFELIIGFIQYFKTATDCLMELFRDNHLLLNNLEVDRILFFITALESSSEDDPIAQSNYIDFLSILCTIDGNPLPKNQLYILENLLVERPQHFLKVRLRGSTNRELQIFREGMGEWISFEAYLFPNNIQQSARRRGTISFQNDYTEVNVNNLNLVAKSVDLAANLCLNSSNSKILTVITQLFPYKVLSTAIENHRLPPKLRSSFSKLLLHAYIKTKGKPCEHVSYNRIWKNLKRAGGGDSAPTAHLEKVDFVDFKFFLEQYLASSSSLDVSQPDNNFLTYSILSLVYHLLDLGEYAFQDLSNLIQIVISILDGRTDIMEDTPGFGGPARRNTLIGGGPPLPLLDEKEANDCTLRYQKKDASLNIVEPKIEICRILQTIFDIRFDQRLTELLHIFKAYMQADGTLHSDTDKQIQQLFSILNDEVAESLVEICLDLLQYHDLAIATWGMSLLIRHFGQRDELFHGLLRVKILVSYRNVATFQMIRQKNEVLRRGLQTPQDETNIKNVLRDFIALCTPTAISKKKRVNIEQQRNFLNLNVHDAVVQMLDTYLSPIRNKNLSKVWWEREIFDLLFSFLQWFVIDNPENQEALFTSFDFLLLFIENNLKAALVIKEILFCNRALCLSLTVHQVKKISNAIITAGKHPLYLEILECICVPSNEPIRKNQNLVIKLLMETQSETLVLFNDQGSIRERNTLIKQICKFEDENDPSSSLILPSSCSNNILSFHIKLIHLFVACCKGKIYEAEIKCQSLYSAPQICSQLLDPQGLLQIKFQFLKFLQHVYFETEKLNDTTYDPILWKVFQHFSSEITKLHVINEDCGSGKQALCLTNDQILKKYCFKAIIPFLMMYFRDHFSIDNVTPEQLAIITKIFQGWCICFYSINNSSTNPFKLKKYKLSIGELLKHFRDFPLISRLFPKKEEYKKAEQFLNKILSEYEDLLKEKIGIKQENTIKKQSEALITKEQSVLEGLKIFSKYFKNAFDTERGVLGLADVLYHGLDNNLTNKFISLLSSLSTVENCSHLVLFSLRALQMILESRYYKAKEEFSVTQETEIETKKNEKEVEKKEGEGEGEGERNGDKDDEEDEEVNVELQNKLDRAGLTLCILKLLSNNNDEIVKETLSLGIALLTGGNKQVQKTILNHCLYNSNQDVLFFASIRNRFRRAMFEIKERQKFYLQKVATSKKSTLLTTEERNGFFQELMNKLTSEEELFPQNSHILKILRFLQLLCEGHNLDLQNYLRSQTNNTESYDLISETAAYLEALDREIDPTNIDIATQVFISLTEYCQGPCEHNQFVLIRSKLCESANYILSNNYDNCDQEKFLELKNEVLLTLLSLLEGNTNTSIPRQMLHSLNLKMIRKNINRNVELINNEMNDISNEHETLIDQSFLYYFLLRTLNDFLNKLESDENNNYQDIFDFLDENFKFLIQNTGTVEIDRHGKLERVYFRIPEICQNLSLKSKRELLWDVKRDNQRNKIEDFFERSHELYKEMDHIDHLKSQPIFVKIYKKEQSFKDFSFIFAILINLLFLYGFVVPSEEDKENRPEIHSFIIALLLFFLGGWQTILNTILLIIYSINYAPQYLRNCWKLHMQLKPNNFPKTDPMVQKMMKKKSKSEDEYLDFDKIPRTYQFYLHSSVFLLKNLQFTFLALCLVCSFLGTIFYSSHPYFFTIHLFDIVNRSPLLKYVIRAVTLNGKTILLTFLLTFVIIYVYAILGFLFFRESFMRDDLQLCDNMFMCLISVFNYGLRSGGGIGDILNPPVWNDSSNSHLFLILYEMSFYFVIMVIMLNIIYGIIIDTFGQLRSQNKAIEHDMENTCFICGIERYMFDRYSYGFERHFQRDHNLWYYLYFIVYLKRKEHTEYTGPEQYVADLISIRDLSFVPHQKAMCLEKFSDVILTNEVQDTKKNRTPL